MWHLRGMTGTQNDLSRAIATALDSERRAAGWSLKDLADAVGVSEQTMGRYLTRMERDIPAGVLVSAVHAIGVPLAVIVDAAERRVSNPPHKPHGERPTA
jgi:transcriptional regulator with XRE-family HTH domain